MKKEVTFGDITVKPGETGFGNITSVELADATVVKTPLIVMNGVADGPSLFLCSARYGHETVGPKVLWKVIRKEVNPKKLRGVIIAAPIGNPLGFQFGSRWSPQDHIAPRFDKPGNPSGSITERIGAAIWEQVTSKVDLMMVVHDNFSPRKNFCLVNLVDPRIREKNMEIAEATGFTIVYSRKPGLLAWNEKHNENYENPPLVMLELVNSQSVWDESVDIGTRAILNVMKRWGMLEGEVEKQPEEYVWGGGRVEDGGTLRASRGGIIHFTKTPGELIRKGEVVAKVYNPYGDVSEEIEFPFDGYIRTYNYSLHQAVDTGYIIAYITHNK